MPYYKNKNDVKEIYSGNGHGSFPLLSENEGCTNGCATGISYYSSVEYTPSAYHDFQEGFMVLSGSGMVIVGDEEFHVDNNYSFIVPANTNHQLRSDKSDVPLVVFWFHAKA